MLVNMFKVPLMAPFAAFHGRNAISNMIMSYMKVGFSMLNKSHAQDYTRALVYYIENNGSDWAKVVKDTIPGSTAMGVGSGGIVGGVSGYNSEDGNFLKKSMNALEGSLTGAAVGAVAGNVLTGITVGGLIGTAGAIKRIGKLKFGDLDKIGNSVVKLKNGQTATIKELVDIADRHGVFNTHVPTELEKELGEGVSDKFMMKEAYRTGELVTEIPFRLMTFITELKESGSIGEATQAVRDTFFDSAQLSVFERRVLRRAIPFYSWTKIALKSQLGGVIANPGRVSNQIKFVNNMGQEEDTDPADLPDWLSNKLKLVSVETNELGRKEWAVRTNLGIPFEEPISIAEGLHGVLTGDTGEAIKLLARGPIGLTPVAEYLVNKDFFRNGVIQPTLTEDSPFQSGKQFKSAPDFIKRAVGYQEMPDGSITVDPVMNWLLNEIPYSRFINVTRQVFEAAPEQKINATQLAQTVLGDKVYRYDVQNQKLYKDKARLDRMALFLKKIRLLKTTSIEYDVFPSEQSTTGRKRRRVKKIADTGEVI